MLTGLSDAGIVKVIRAQDVGQRTTRIGRRGQRVGDGQQHAADDQQRDTNKANATQNGE